jgi:natural resistance-associated macrophage protein
MALTGDRSPQRLSRSSYGSISSPSGPGPQQAPPKKTYLSEKIPIPDTEQVGMLGASWGLWGLTGSSGILQAEGGGPSLSTKQ